MIFPKKENSLIKKEHDKVDVLSSDKLRNSIMDSFNDKSKKKNKIIYPKKTKKKKWMIIWKLNKLIYIIYNLY